MKRLLTILAMVWSSTCLFAQNSSLTLYITSTIPEPTELTVLAVPMGTSDTTVVDVVMVTDIEETVVVYSFPDSIGGASIFLSYYCDGAEMSIPGGFAFGPNTPGGDPVDADISIEIGCMDMDCEWYLDVEQSNDLNGPTTFNVVFPNGQSGGYEWYVDGELVPPNTPEGGLIWQAPYEIICAVMFSMEDCPDPGTQCYEAPNGGGGGMPCLDGIDVGALIIYLTTQCADQTNPDFWMYCGLMESLTAAMNGDEDACDELWAWLDAGGWEGETGCDINFEVMQAWEANGELIPNEVWVWIYDYDSEYTYTYDFGDGSPATSEINPSHTYDGNGPYTFCITVSSEADSCSATYCDTLSVDDDGILFGEGLPLSGFTVNVFGGGEVSVQNPDWDEFEIFPNPVTDGQLQLRGLNLRKGVVHAELVSLTGARINVDMNSVNSATGECILHIGDLTPGIYLLRIEQQGMWATRKLVVR